MSDVNHLCFLLQNHVRFKLQDIDFVMARGELAAIIGRVGCGKVGITQTSFKITEQDQMCRFHEIPAYY